MPGTVPVHAVASALWGDEPPASWESALRTHVARLKKLLLTVPGAPQVIHAREGYALEGNVDAIDVHRFQGLIGRAEVAESVADQCLLRDEAADLWRGTPFRDADDPDLRELSAQLEALYEENERRRNLLAVELGDGEAVVGRLLPKFDAEPAEAGQVEPLVCALLALGRDRDARSVLSRHRSALESRGWEPSAVVASLERRAVAADLTRNISDDALSAALPAMLRQDKLLVGRTSEVNEFRNFLSQGDVSFIVLQGPAGIGKSHLLSSWASVARADKIPVLGTWADEHSSPFQPVADLLQPWADLVGAPSGESLEMLLSALVDLSENRRVVVMFDDLHFADLATTKALRRIVRRTPIEGVTLVFTVRDTFRNPLVDQLLRDLQDLDSARILQVGPLSIDDTFELVRQSERLTPSTAWTRAGRLFRMSAGFPLVLDFLIGDQGNSADYRGRDGTDSVEVVEAPDLIEFPPQRVDADAVTLAAAGRLSDSDLDIVVTGALLGLVVEIPILVDAVTQSIATVHDALDRAHEAGLTEQRTGTSVRFRHPLIQRALWQSRSAVWRCQRSRSLAEALTRRSGDVFAISHQLALAIPNETSNLLLKRVFEGLDQLHEQQRWEEAFALLETTASTLDLEPWWVETEDLFRYFLLFAMSADGCADGELAREYFRKAKALADRERRAEWLFEVAIRSSVSSQPLDGDAERASWLRTAFDPASGLDDRRRIQALAEFVYLRGLSAVDAEVNECVAEMERLASVLDDDRTRAYYAHGALVAMLCSSDATGRLEFCERARNWGRAVPPEIAVTPILASVFSLLQLGRRAEVDREISQIEDLVNLRQRPGDRWMMLLFRAMLAEWDGQSDVAEHHARSARNLAIRHDIHGGREAWGLFQMSRVYRTNDRFAARRFAVDRDDLMPVEQAVAARFLACDGQFAVAERIIDRVLPALVAGPPNLTWLPACLALAETAALTGSMSRERLYSLLLPFSGVMVINGLVASSTFGPVDRVLHLLALSLDDKASAKRFEARVASQLAGSGLSGWSVR